MFESQLRFDAEFDQASPVPERIQEGACTHQRGRPAQNNVLVQGLPHVAPQAEKQWRFGVVLQHGNCCCTVAGSKHNEAGLQNDNDKARGGKILSGSVKNGGIAQMKEHLLCKQGVAGLIPVASTSKMRA